MVSRRNSKHRGRVSSSSVAQSVSSKSERAAMAELKEGCKQFEQTATDLVVVNLEIIPKLLFEGMVSNNVTTVESAVENLADVFRLSSSKRMEAYEAGGQAVLIITMKKWRDNESIQTSSCRCIQNMSCTNTEAKESFAAIGALESVINAMRAFPTSQKVQRSGCGALMNLLSGSDEESALLDSMAEKFVSEYDGIHLVVMAMKNFPDEIKIQLWGNGLFQNLAQNHNFRLDMMQAGAITAAGASLERHSKDANIKTYASKFMKIMFANA